MPHVMPKWYREDHADLERREFIREAAIAIAARGNVSGAAGAWVVAIDLWNAKPEDA